VTRSGRVSSVMVCVCVCVRARVYVINIMLYIVAVHVAFVQVVVCFPSELCVPINVS